MSATRKELNPAVYDTIKAHCAKGDELAEAREFDKALVAYNAAWVLVPEPKTDWNASTWILAAIGDAAFQGGHNTLAREALQDAMLCPDGIGNPFLHLRLGQVLFDDEQLDVAADELMRAYMGGGPEIFATEDPRYLEFLKTRAII